MQIHSSNQCWCALNEAVVLNQVDSLRVDRNILAAVIKSR